ncbi:MAG TPA: hypothetical protein VFG83_02580 [Kofleriaceae bacterium]|nr:hypothetical protein [Kofleriaceae bacterium]
MTLRGAYCALAIGALLAAGACSGIIGDPPGTDPTADPAGRTNTADDQVVKSHEGKLSTNGLVLDEGALAALSPAPLGDQWTGQNAIALSPTSPMAALAATPEGRELLRYVALCALDPEVTLVIDQTSPPLRFAGLYALAPAWADSPLDDAGQRWVSACLLAHANATGDAVWVSLRGAHPGLSWDEAIRTDFPVQEAAYYGNLFAASPALFACLGQSLFNGQWATQDSYLNGRLCGVQESSCGLSQTGPCASLAGTIGGVPTGACEIAAGDGGGFGNCHTARAGIASPVLSEVVTVYLEK